LAEALPAGWIKRVHIVFSGRAITLQCLGRSDLLMSKVFALCDRGIDLQDCLALAPTIEELDQITAWLERQDANPGWPEHVRATITDLKERLDRGI
jgi:hypothetical protein